MVKSTAVGILLLISCISSGQETFLRAGNLKASATISPSSMLNRSIRNVYINGFIAYQLEERLSLRGDAFFYMNSKAKAASDIGYNGAMHTYFGVFYHLRKGNWDNYLGFQPGLSITSTPFKSGASANPTYSAKLGTAFYVWKYFHFFTELTYWNVHLRGVAGGSMRMDELVLSAGLGFQINTRKE